MKRNISSVCLWGFFLPRKKNLEKVKYAEGSEMEGKENPGHIKNKQKTNTKMHTLCFPKKPYAKTKLIAIFIWTPDLQTFVLGCHNFVPLPRKGAGSLWWLQEEMLRLHPCSFSFSSPHP